MKNFEDVKVGDLCYILVDEYNYNEHKITYINKENKTFTITTFADGYDSMMDFKRYEEGLSPNLFFH